MVVHESRLGHYCTVLGGPTTQILLLARVCGRKGTVSLITTYRLIHSHVRPLVTALVVNRNALLTHVRPLDTARRRSNPEVIELTDSDGRRGSHGTSAVLGDYTTMSNCSKDPIVISSDSEGNSPRFPARMRRRSAPTFHSAKKSHSTPRCGRDFITILDSDDDHTVAPLSVTQENRQSTTAAPSVSTTIIGTQPMGSSEPRPISVSEAESSLIIKDAANPDPVGSMPEYDMDVGSCPASPAFPEPSPPRTCSPSSSPGRLCINDTRTYVLVLVNQLTGMTTVDLPFGDIDDIDLDLGNADDDVADAGLDMDVDGIYEQNLTEARNDRRGVMDLKVNGDVAAKEPCENMGSREIPQVSLGLKTIARSSIKSSDKVGTASHDHLVPLESSTQAQSSKLSSETTIGLLLGAVPSVPKEFVLPDVSSYSVRFNRPESSQSSFFSRAFGSNTSTPAITMPLISKESIIEETASRSGAVVEVQAPKPNREGLLLVAGLSSESTKEHSGAEDLSQSPTSGLAALTEPSTQNTCGPPTSEVKLSTTTQEAETPLSTGVLSVRPSGSENSFVPSWEGDPSSSVQSSVVLPAVQSPKPPSRSTSATPAVQTHATTSCPSIPPPCKPPPLSSASLVDTLNQIRRDHLQAKVARRKSKEPALQSENRLEQTTPQPLASNEVRSPSTPPQSQASRGSRFHRESSSRTPLRLSLHDQRPTSSGLEPSLSEAVGHPTPRSVSESSSSTCSATMEPSTHLLADAPNFATTTTATSASSATIPHPTSPAFPRRVPASFEEFISKSPTTDRSLLTQPRPGGPSPSQRSPRRSIGVPFDRFIVKAPRGRNSTSTSEESTLRASSSSVARVAGTCLPSQACDVPDDAIKEGQWPQHDGNCVIDDKSSAEVRTDDPHTGFDADQLLELADVHLESSELNIHPPLEGYPRPLAGSSVLKTDVETAVVAEYFQVEQTLPAGAQDSVAAPRDSLMLDYQPPVMTPSSGDTGVVPVDTKIDVWVTTAAGYTSH
ncbi:hypothetical protein BKA83DRAFT_243351 [Pisolithus microcarpus]|nr:hypothetical protein BKA83DRAFT_243351 [Pisolithus microcarpus]